MMPEKLAPGQLAARSIGIQRWRQGTRRRPATRSTVFDAMSGSAANLVAIAPRSKPVALGGSHPVIPAHLVTALAAGRSDPKGHGPFGPDQDNQAVMVSSHFLDAGITGISRAGD
jgi:hypothetical protein